MRSELARLDLAQLTGEGAAHAEQAAFVRTAFLQDSDGKIPRSEVARPADKVLVQATVEPAQVESPLDKVGGALKKFMEGGGKLTPEIKKEFEGAIADTEKGPSPAIPELKKKAGELEAEMKALFPPDKQKAAKDLQDGIGADLQKLPDDKKQIMGILMGALQQAQDPADQEKIVAKMKEVAPEAMDKMDKLDKLLGPVMEKAAEYQSVQAALAAEEKDGIVSRILYAQVCLHAGDTPTAAKHIRDAAAKDQELLQDPQFMMLAKQAGLEAKDLRVNKV